jgi:Divergent InlB B-repeat domain
MRRLVSSLVVAGCLAALLGGAASAGSGSRKMSRRVFVSINGWGTVKPVKGFIAPHAVRCTEMPDCSRTLFAKQRYVTLTAKPSSGWRFVGWGRACRKYETRACTLDRSRFLPGQNARVTAKFVPVAKGLADTAALVTFEAAAT